MYVCYVDEAGCTGALPDKHSAIQPVFTLAGLFVPQTAVRAMTHDLINLKQRWFPNLVPANSPYHDWMMAEVKGADIRRKARSTARNDRRFAYGVIQDALNIMSKHDSRLVGRVYIKPIGGPFAGVPVYSSAVQRICADFQHFLDYKQTCGIVIADSRNKAKNAPISHSIFTQSYSAHGDPYPSILEMPTFGHSDNHAGLQLTDILCSSLLFPIAAEVCCLPHMVDLTHCHAQHATLRARYGVALKDLQYRYSTQNNMWYGGISLSDPVNKFKASVFFT